MPTKYFTVSLFFLVLAVQSVCAGDPVSLCTAGEEAVFDCAYGKKVVSICAGYRRSNALRYVQYRFGKGRPEIAIPPVDNFELNKFHGTVDSGAHGGSEALTVSNGEYAYQIYTVWDMHGRIFDSAFVRVMKGRVQVARFTCTPMSDLGFDDSGLRALIVKNKLQPVDEATMSWFLLRR